MTSPTLLVTRDGCVARLTLNRPDNGNALNQEMAGALRHAVSECAADDSIRCLVLTGAGRLFCAGGDIKAFGGDPDSMPAALERLARTLHEAIVMLFTMRKPLLTLVNGPAAGAGLSLAITGDVVLCARSAHFTAAYGTLGLTPDGGMSWHLPRLVGLRRAQEIIMTNRRVAAVEAEAIGLVTRAVDDGALAQEGAKSADELSRMAIGAFAAARAVLAASWLQPLPAQLDLEVRSIVAMACGPEAREGVTAFAQKRKPDFRGV